MTPIHLELLTEEHADVLFHFEKDNRSSLIEEHFSRKPHYYDRNTFQLILENLVEEQGKKTLAMYLIFEEKELVGRINLIRMLSEPFFKAEIGYRIDHAHQRKGYASEAVRILLEKAQNIYGLHRLEAGADSENVAARRVLEKNGFRYVGTYEHYILIGDQWVDNALYEKVLKD